MSLLRLIRQQLGMSNTPNNNFTLDASADNGTMKLSRGNAGATTQDLITVSAANIITGGVGATLVGNGPAFSAFCSTPVSVTGSIATRVSFQTKDFDTNNAFDSVVNFRFQPNIPGYYSLASSVHVLQTGSMSGEFRKNGVLWKVFSYTGGVSPSNPQVSGSCLIFLNGSSDYAEVWVSPGVTGNLIVNSTYFQGVLVRAA